jgi:outer membrane protein
MKYIVNFFVVTLLLLVSTHTFAEQKIVVLDMKYVLNQSKAGKGAQDFLKKSFNDNQKKFSDLEKELKKEENDLLGKKTILSKEEYEKKANTLRKKVIDYQSDRRTSLEKIAAQRSESRTKLLKKIEPILSSYIKENDIALVIDKKDLLGGRPELNITEDIIKKLNKELPSLDLK